MEGILIRNALYPRNGKLQKCHLTIKGDRIKSFSYYRVKAHSDYRIIDADGLLLMPGVIDPHVHFREPGLTHKETLYSGSVAAAAGGVTTVFDMPNTIPPTVTMDALNEKRELAKNMIVNHAFYFGGIAAYANNIKKAHNVPGTKVYMDITTGKHMVSEKEELKSIFRKSKLVAVHAEGMRVKTAIELATETKRKLYCCHISLAKEISIIAQAKLNRKGFYCEVTPHHLFLTHEDDKTGFTKMKPPLRSKEDQEALWEGIRNGIIDTIGTDHAPHTKEEKESDSPPFGVPGIETSLPLMLTAARDGKISYEKVIELMCHNPASIFRIRGRGRIKPAFFADLVLVDIENTKKVEAANMKTKCGWSPYEGMELTGWPKITIVNGKVVYEDGNIIDTPAREVQFR